MRVWPAGFRIPILRLDGEHGNNGQHSYIRFSYKDRNVSKTRGKMWQIHIITCPIAITIIPNQVQLIDNTVTLTLIWGPQKYGYIDNIAWSGQVRAWSSATMLSISCKSLRPVSARVKQLLSPVRQWMRHAQSSLSQDALSQHRKVGY